LLKTPTQKPFRHFPQNASAFKAKRLGVFQKQLGLFPKELILSRISTFSA